MENSTKLLINLKEGIVQVEGTEGFVRDVYNDFKERVSKPVVLPPAPVTLEELSSPPPADDEDSSRRKPAKARAKRASSGPKTGETANYKPKFDNDLKTTGLAEFYAKYAPATHSEKVLVFAAFMRDKLSKSPCTADDIYTCYATLKEKIPTAFVQAFRDCQNRFHYIRYESPTELEVAIPGDNFLNEKK